MKDLEGPLALIVEDALGASPGSMQYESLKGTFPYVDFIAMGSFDSPQLFPREGEDGQWLPWNLQSWPQDLDLKPAPTRSERVYFQLMMPRKEVSARGEGKPAPLVIIGHGYTGNRFTEAIAFGAYLARQGIASLSIDCVSHGLDLGGDEEARP